MIKIKLLNERSIFIIKYKHHNVYTTLYTIIQIHKNTSTPDPNPETISEGFKKYCFVSPSRIIMIAAMKKCNPR